MKQKNDHNDPDFFLDHFLTLDRGIARLEKLGTMYTYPKNTILFQPGEKADHCFIVKSGRVAAFEYSYTGEQRIFNFMEPGSIFAEELMLFDKVIPVTFKTMTESNLIYIDKCDLKRAFKHDIDIVLDICESITDKYLSAMELQRFMPLQSSEWKVCKFFLMAANHYGINTGNKILIQEKFSQQTIADLLGMNRVTVTRIIGKLTDQKVLERDGQYYVLESLEALQNYSESIRYENEN